jgi:hypothetical protein
MKLDMRDVLDINDTDFRDELLSLLGFDPEDTEDLMKFKDYGLI